MRTKQLVAVLSGLCMIASVQAQTNQSQNQTNVLAAVPGGELPVYNIDFPGGTPGLLIDQMAKESRTRPNVIIPAYLAEVQIPKFKLQNVNTSQVFDALNMVSDEKGARELRWISEGPKEAPNRVWTLIKAASPRKAETCQVAYIGNLLGAFQLDDINAAIRTAWEMLGKSSTPALKFHRETKLLIAKGDEEELKLVVEVLKSLDMAAKLTKQAQPQ
jgi:hypothetical protein